MDNIICRLVRSSGFTLIELLIVVAIIAILAAIAIPNFLLAQTRAKVSKILGDFRTIGTALESYYVDNNAYPRLHDAGGSLGTVPPPGWHLKELSSPVAYISTVPIRDPFDPFLGAFQSYYYTDYRTFDFWKTNFPGFSDNWELESQGPNRRADGAYLAGPFAVNFSQHSFRFYDPTNGIISNGDILRYGPGNLGYPR